jgi:CBS domain containing-hemolysin-like protein
MVVMLIIVLIFFILAGFFSGMETGLISLNRYKILKEAKSDSNKNEILNFLKSPDKILGTTLLGTNISVVIVSTLSVYLIKNSNIKIDENIFSLIVAGFLLIFSEIIPKAVYRDNSYKLVTRYFPILKLFYKIFKPFVNIIGGIQHLLSKVLKLETEKAKNYLTHDELSYIVASTGNSNNLSRKDKNISDKKAKEAEEYQSEILKKAVDFSKKKAENVMTHRTEIVAIEKDTPITEVIDIAKKEGKSRFPVYKEDLDHIEGILIIYDILQAKDIDKAKAKDFIRETIFVPEQTKALSLLQKMKTQKKSMAIVVDSYGGTAGIVTIEDLLEEFMGEIEDEYDIIPKEIERLAKNEYLVNADLEIELLNEKLNLDIPQGDYETIAGFLISKFNRIPTKGTKYKTDKWLMEIKESDKRKIDKIKITIFQQNSSEKR